MKFKSFFLIFIGLVLASVSFSKERGGEELPEDIHRFTLDNGLTVVIAEDHDSPEIFGELVVNVGAKDGPEEATGMAHYLEHMLFKGTKALGTTNWEKEKKHIDRIYSLYDELGELEDTAKRSSILDSINEASKKAQQYGMPSEFESVVKKMGGTGLNANTSYDRTVYFNMFPAHQLEQWLTLYAHRMKEPVFRDFQAELEVVYEEKNRALDNQMRQAFQEYWKVAYPEHPYGQRKVLGTVDDLKNPSLNKMKEFFETWYVPNNMSLILSGDLDPKKARPLIEKTFGEMERQELPERKTYERAEYDGREEYAKELAPIKGVIRGYRTVPSGHEDEFALNVMDKVLSNSNGTGILDELNRQDEIMRVQYLHRNRKDRGGATFIILPKQVFQSKDKAEEIVAERIQRLKEGDLSSKKLKAIKKQIYREWKLDMEGIKERGYRIGEALAQNRDLGTYLNYPEKIQEVDKEKVVELANTYFDSNYVSFHVERGSMDKPEAEAPDFDPITPETDRSSPFAKKLERMEGEAPELEPIDMDGAIEEMELGEGGTLYHNAYEENDIFSLTFKFRVGERRIEELEYASSVSSLATVEGMKSEELKLAFDTLGAKYSISSNRNSTHFTIKGLKSGLPEALSLMNRLINELDFGEDATDKIVTNARNSRIMERAQKQTISAALREYLLFRDSSSYLDRYKMTELKSLDPEDLEKAFQRATRYECEVHYAGQRDPEEVEELLSEKVALSEDPQEGVVPRNRDLKDAEKKEVFFVEKDDALQNSISFLVPGKAFQLEQIPRIQAFNSYFGSSFTGLMFRRIRMQRSLAYSTASWYIDPRREGELGAMVAIIGTQADKTTKATEAFLDMKKDMPRKAHRVDMIRDHLINSTIPDVPSPRELSEEILEWRRQGYEKDPRVQRMKEYRDLQYADIQQFYEEFVQDSPTVIAMVGNKEAFDLEKLKEHGDFRELDKNDLFEEAWLPQVFFSMVSSIAG